MTSVATARLTNGESGVEDIKVGFYPAVGALARPASGWPARGSVARSSVGKQGQEEARWTQW